MIGCTRLVSPAPAVKLVRSSRTSSRLLRIHASNKGSFGDGLLDYIQAGPKLRKWYGASDLPRDGGDFEPEKKRQPEPEPEDDGVKDAVLVTEAESLMGEQIVLQLILKRAKIKLLVKDTVAAKTAYGPYVIPVEGSVDNAASLQKAMKGVRCVVAAGKLGATAQVAKQAQVEQIVMVSAVGSTAGGLFSFLGEQSILRDASRETTVMNSGVPYTLIKTGKINDVPGGGMKLKFEAGNAPSGEISREDLARVVANVAMAAPQSSFSFEVMNDGPGVPPDDWNNIITSLADATVST